MKQTIGGVEWSLVDHRVASREAFLLVPGQDQGWPRAEQGGRGGNPSRAMGEVGP